MTHPTEPLIFDGHNDLLLKLWFAGADAIPTFATGTGGQIDRPRAQAGGFAGGMFAIFVPGGAKFDIAALRAATYDLPEPPPVPLAEALQVTLSQAAILLELDRRGDLMLCRNARDIRSAMAAGQIAAVMHLEGAEAIGPDLEQLMVLHAAGLRSIGPVWSRQTIFGHGVPFRYPGDGDVGPGLTDAGKALARRAQELGMVFDTSHLNVAGFWDVGELGLPLVATHSNAHAVCAHARNLLDDQLRAIGETGGMVGLNLATAFLRPDGRMVPEGAMEPLIRHLDHMIAMAGEDHVGIGSDFDGGLMPQEIGSVAGLPALRQAMTDAGYNDALIKKICHGNWLSALERILGE
ncbi:MAG: dipeptidase [Pseudomonadota bacterium]